MYIEDIANEALYDLKCIRLLLTGIVDIDPEDAHEYQRVIEKHLYDTQYEHRYDNLGWHLTVVLEVQTIIHKMFCGELDHMYGYLFRMYYSNFDLWYTTLDLIVTLYATGWIGPKKGE